MTTLVLNIVSSMESMSTREIAEGDTIELAETVIEQQPKVKVRQKKAASEAPDYDVRLGVNMPSKKHKAFKAKAKDSKYTMAKLVNLWIDKYLDDALIVLTDSDRGNKV